MYKYYGMDITPAIMKELLIELFDGKQFNRNFAINKVKEYHENSGGIISQKNYVTSFKAATKLLKSNGLLNCGYGVWRLNYKKEKIEIMNNTIEKQTKYLVKEVIGEGDKSIYVYYYDVYKKFASIKNEEFFPCKIGRTDNDIIQRVIGQCTTSYPEMPQIALIIKCKDSAKLELAIHSILKYKSKWMDNAPGNEWFLTNPEEIKNIYLLINSIK